MSQKIKKMKTHTRAYLAMLPFVVLIACGCNQKKTKPPSNSTTVSNPLSTPDLQISTTTPEPEPEIIPEKVPKTLTPSAKCDKTDFDLLKNIQESAQSLEGTPYSQANKTDCSGMFHKVLERIKMACPNSILPSINNARSTRDLAKWYHDHGDFRIIRNPKDESDLIQPGAVMFYGYGNRAWPYDHHTITLDTLVVQGVGINHVAIITSVKRENGVVKFYEIFHGLNPSKPAGTTTSHRIYNRNPDLPVYGNWKEPWLAVANVLGRKE